MNPLVLAIPVACALLSPPAAVPPQQGAAPGSQLPTLESALELTMMLDRDAWTEVVLRERQDDLRSTDKVIVDLLRYHENETVELGKRDAVRRYEGELVDAFAALKKLDAATRFLYLPGDVPIVFATVDSRLAVIFTGFVSSQTYNSARSTAAGRAAEVLRASVLPALKAFSAFAKVPDISFYGLSVVYGSRDLAGTDPSVAESVTLVVPADSCQAFLAEKLTDAALVAGASVYLADRDTPVGMKKVNLAVK